MICAILAISMKQKLGTAVLVALLFLTIVAIKQIDASQSTAFGTQQTSL